MLNLKKLTLANSAVYLFSFVYNRAAASAFIVHARDERGSVANKHRARVLCLAVSQLILVCYESDHV